MSERQPTEVDFVKDEWAVIFLFCDGHHELREVRHDYWTPEITHWRRVRLAPPPLAKLATPEQRDEAAWKRYRDRPELIYSGDITSWDIFMAGRRTQREEIKELVKACEISPLLAPWYNARTEWQQLCAAVGLE